MSKITHGPFTWIKREPTRESPEEVWTLQRPEGMTHFVVKNYGGKPGPGFAGWKLVSGGPFDRAGAYANLKAAITGVTPYLVDYYKAQAAAKLAEANRIIQMVSNFSDQVTQVTVS